VSGERTAVRAYGALLGLYPSQFRAEYGADMVQLVRDQCDDEPPWRVCGRAVIDLAITLPTQHLEAHMKRNPDHLVPLFYAGVAGGGVLLAILGGTNAAMLIIGLSIFVAAGVMAALAWRRSGPLRGMAATGGWWKFVAAGPCIVVSVIIAAGLGVDAWFVAITCVFAAFVLTGIGLVLGLVRLTHRRATSPNT
jgi:hypothetical protein